MLLTLAIKELRLVCRDLHGLAVLLAMPTAFILIMSLALQESVGGGLPSIHVAIDSQDSGPHGAATINALLSQGNIHRAENRQAPFRLHIPPRFSEQLFEAPDRANQPLLSWESHPTVLPQARAAFSAALTGAISRTQGDALLDTLEAEQGGDFSRLREVMAPDRWNIRTGVIGQQAKLPNAIEQSVPAWLVFAMFFVVVPLSTVMIIEREQGTAMRLRAMRVPAITQLLARVPAYYIVNMLQMAAMLAVGVWLMPLLGIEGLETGRHPLALLVAGSATSIAAIGLALLIAVGARTSMHAIAIGGAINLIFGALGGIMVPKMVMPFWMQSATALSPMSWALDGFWGVLLRGHGVLDTLVGCLPLLGFGVLMLSIATWWHSRRQE